MKDSRFLHAPSPLGGKLSCILWMGDTKRKEGERQKHSEILALHKLLSGEKHHSTFLWLRLLICWLIFTEASQQAELGKG